ncbi:prepilin peptidase [Nocardiopsis oceani]
MPTPLALSLTPLLPWAVLAAAALGVLGVVVGRGAGRLVRLFGPACPPAVTSAAPVPHRTAEGRAAPGRESSTGIPEEREGAPGAPAEPPPGDQPSDTAPSADLPSHPADPGPAPDELEEDDDGPPPPCCPHCRAELVFVRALPYVAARPFRQRGACPHCEQLVRPHPAVVVSTALLFAAVGALLPWHLLDWSVFGLLAVLWFVALGTSLAVIDLRVMRLPDVIVAPAYPVAALLLAAAVLLPPSGPDLERGAKALVGMALITVLYWSLWRIRPGGLGFGDVKLSGLTGLYAGWAAGPVGALVAAFWAFAAFSLLGLALMALRRITRAEPLPLGPFMLAATFLTLLAGQPLAPQP